MAWGQRRSQRCKGYDVIKCEVTTLNVSAEQLTCPTRQLIPDAIRDDHETGMGGHARVIRWQVYLLYNQRARDGNGVYPFAISV